MPVPPPLAGYAAAITATTTVQNILNGTCQDVRQILYSGDPVAQGIVMDYISRAQLMILRASRWYFLRSDIQRFITSREQINYWIGPAGQAPPATVDTQLNLGDLDRVEPDSVWDASNFRQLLDLDARPQGANLTFQDANYRPGKPAAFRQDPGSNNILTIFPAPDNENSYQPVPTTPYCTITLGGALPARTYYINTTYVDSFGNEGTQNDRECEIEIPAGYLLVVNPPIQPLIGTTLGPMYAYYNVYASEQTQGELKQNASPVSILSTWTEPTSGLITNTPPPPISSNLTQMDGYIIEFRYYTQREIINSLDTIVQVPDIYRDVLVAGVNWLALRYLKRSPEAQEWKMDFMSGIQQIIRDINLQPMGGQFIKPDPAAMGIGSNSVWADPILALLQN